MKTLVARVAISAAVAGTGLLALSVPAQARDHGWRGDSRHFAHRDIRHGHSGSWHHGHHGGRLGWWWVVGGLWYFHPRPVYPYPDPYRPPVVVIEQPAPPVVVQPPPVAQPPSPPPVVVPAPVQYWYYCDAAKGYYPYVPACPTGWSKVPATPPGATP